MPAAVEPKLTLVVALFRHGVRAPLKDIDDPKKPHAGTAWPTKPQWGVEAWGDLTPHGVALVRALGRDYAETYKNKWPGGFRSFLWADLEPRTCATADALMAGFKDGGIAATVDSRDEGPDPLFHAFGAHCGKPDPATLSKIATKISDHSESGIKLRFGRQFAQLCGVLACPPVQTPTPTPGPPNCEPLQSVSDNSAHACVTPTPGPVPTPTPCSAPIKWDGQFPYANTASETFLLEYANKMEVGWGNVLGPPPDGNAKLLSMMRLHEFYFDQMQREEYLAKIEASNLIREIGQTLNGENAPCRRIPPGYQFAALVGHDTNIASVGALLRLSWQFNTAPPGTSGLPDNDPLPAGALLFELWREGNDSFVRIFYAAQGLREMRTFKAGACPAFRVPVRCDSYSVEPNVCKVPLKIFNEVAGRVLGREFLSQCADDGQQVCGERVNPPPKVTPSAGPRTAGSESPAAKPKSTDAP
jgi:4-phytase/acid phosphatase